MSPSPTVGSPSTSDAPALVRVTGLHKAFGGRPVLRGIDLELRRGWTTVVLGGSGSGKSVLLRHIAGLLRPDAGQVWLGDVDIGAAQGADLLRIRRQLGVVFQNGALFDSMSVGDNVAFPLREHTRLPHDEVDRRVARVLGLVGLSGTERRLPAELSGGMRKRVAIARAVVADPQLVLYDEPTSGLDPVTTRQVDQLITDARQALGVTSLVITHDMGSALRIADHIAFLYQGAILMQGPPEGLLASDDPRVRAFLGSEARSHT